MNGEPPFIRRGRVRPWWLAVAWAAACGPPVVATSGPRTVDLPVLEDGAAAVGFGASAPRQAPPPSDSTRDASIPPFPRIARTKLPNGLGLDVVSVRSLPLAHVRLVVHAGKNDGGVGIGAITASMLENGGTRAMTGAEVSRRIESLGADLAIQSDPDATVFSLALTTESLDTGLGILSQVVREPRFDAHALKKLKTRRSDELEDAARSDPTFVARSLFFRELFPPEHPYRAYAPLPSQISKIEARVLRDFHAKFYVPTNATLIVAGDIAVNTAAELAAKHFGSWAGPPAPLFARSGPLRAPSQRRVLLAHRPKSAQSEIDVVVLAPERATLSAPLRIANQILGGGAGSRLFDDVRERRSLAYRTYAQIVELSRGPQPLAVHAGTETSKTASAVAALLENMQGMKSRPPSLLETASAARYLSDVFALRIESVGSIADLVATQETFGLPDGYWDTFRRDLRAADATGVTEVAGVFGDPLLVVVSGDADRMGSDLTRFGDVTVYDPEKEFNVMRTLPAGAK